VGPAEDRGAPSIPSDLEDRGPDGISPSSCREAAAGGKTGKLSCRRGSRDFGGAGAGGLIAVRKQESVRDRLGWARELGIELGLGSFRARAELESSF
jgi:hypothetical protein